MHPPMTAYERHGSVVIVASLMGSCCTEGFSNEAAMAGSDYTPTMSDLVSALAVLRPYVRAQIWRNEPRASPRNDIESRLCRACRTYTIFKKLDHCSNPPWSVDVVAVRDRVGELVGDRD